MKSILSFKLQLDLDWLRVISLILYTFPEEKLWNKDIGILYAGCYGFGFLI